MLRLFRVVALFPALLFALPLLAADKDKGPLDKPTEDPKVRSRLLQADYLEGKLIQADAEGEEKTFILEVTQKVRQTNPKVQEKLTELGDKYQKMIIQSKGKPDPNAVKKMADEIAELRKQLIEVVDVHYEFQLKGDKDLILRRQRLEPKVGDDGKPAKYTKEELEKARGENTKLPGYTAEVKDFDKDVLVRAWIDHKKYKPAAKKDDTPPTYPLSMLMLLPAPEEKDPKTKDKK